MSEEQKSKDALTFLSLWQTFSDAALKVLAPNCPIRPPDKRTRPWADPKGPRGILFHYTGGPNGVASIRWCNENPQNNSSSWHVTVFDRLLPQLDHFQEQFAEVFMSFPTTAILHAPITRGTWHGNWTNDFTFGIENRNMGRVLREEGTGRLYRTRFRKDRKPKKLYAPNGKQASPLASSRTDFVWEAYTTEQILTNLAIGRLLHAWRGCSLDPNWILPHSAVCHQKSDTGPAFPMQALRRAIYNPQFTEVFKRYLDKISISRNLKLDNTDIILDSPSQDDLLHHTTHRGKHSSNPRLRIRTGEVTQGELHWLMSHGTLLHLLEYNTPDTILTELDIKQNLQDIRLACAIYQRASQYSRREPLIIDGTFGKKTAQHIEKKARRTYKDQVVDTHLK